ncbi:MAG: pyridoxamine 5'-phosphate oxidase family protein [Clostridia bacterium]|nr:pyridoxamine 5'-phosphate oxidase family protein [Clostridia bacterium]
MFRDLTRQNRAATREECIRLLESEKRGVLAVLGDGGYPYAMPMNHWYDTESGCIWFHAGRGGHREDALRQCSKVSYCVHDEGWTAPGDWVKNVTSAIVFGRVEIVDDQAEVIRVASALTRKFTPDEKYLQFELEHFAHETLLLRLTPEHMCGKHVAES